MLENQDFLWNDVLAKRFFCHETDCSSFSSENGWSQK